MDDDDDVVHGESTILFCRGFSLLGEGAFYLIHHCDNFPLLLAICLPINSSRGTDEKKSAKEEREKYGQRERAVHPPGKSQQKLCKIFDYFSRMD